MKKKRREKVLSMKKGKERILLVGQTPSKFTGNGNMMQMCINQVDQSQYDLFALLFGTPYIEGLKNPWKDPYNPGCRFFYLQKEGNDWGSNQLLQFLEMYEVDQIIFIGIDIWRYLGIMPKIRKICSQKKIIWKVLAPYDLTKFREDWGKWFNQPDQVYIYSEYGYNILKEHIENCYYFRPQPRYLRYLKPPSSEEKLNLRKALFPDATEETIIIGFIGNNQVRKNVLRMMEGVAEISKQEKNIIFYLHMDTVTGMYDIEMLAQDLKFPKKMVRHNGRSRRLFPEELISVCKTFDLYLLPSIQEGLSWTVIEMALLGIPCALSLTTSHKDYLQCETIKQLAIPMKDTASLALPTDRGISYIPTKACSPKDIAESIQKFINLKRKEPDEIELVKEDMLHFGKEWVKGCHNMSMILRNKTVKNIGQFKSKLGEVL